MGNNETAEIEERKLVIANNALGLRLMGVLHEKDPTQNIFVSPFSIALALAMAYNGAEGKTKQCLADLLGYTGMDCQEVNEANASFASMTADQDPRVQLEIANAIWAKQGIRLASDFEKRIVDYYQGQVANVDFNSPSAADTINRWVSDKTHKMIEALVTPDVIQSARLILTNAVYFKGLWSSPFDIDKTEAGIFHKLDGSQKKHPFMCQSGQFPYYNNGRFQAISLAYGENRRLSMVIVLPEPSISLTDFYREMKVQDWERWNSKLRLKDGDILLPRFKMSFEANIFPSLVAMAGGELASVDFLGMGAGPLEISKVIHKAVMEVNEEGTEAAAATAVVMLKGIVERFHMVADRPFLCAIVDHKTGLLLFAGLVMDPKEG